MLEGVNYLKYQGHEEFINEFFDSLFFFRDKKAIDVLKKYCELRGNAINDFMSCHFATEFPDKNDEEYFGGNGVVFYLDYPAVDEDCAVILTYDEFLEVVKRKYESYIQDNQEKRDEIILLLESLEKVIKSQR